MPYFKNGSHASDELRRKFDGYKAELKDPGFYYFNFSCVPSTIDVLDPKTFLYLGGLHDFYAAYNLMGHCVVWLMMSGEFNTVEMEKYFADDSKVVDLKVAQDWGNKLLSKDPSTGKPFPSHKKAALLETLQVIEMSGDQIVRVIKYQHKNTRATSNDWYEFFKPIIQEMREPDAFLLKIKDEKTDNTCALAIKRTEHDLLIFDPVAGGFRLRNQGIFDFAVPHLLIALCSELHRITRPKIYIRKVRPAGDLLLPQPEVRRPSFMRRQTVSQPILPPQPPKPVPPSPKAEPDPVHLEQNTAYGQLPAHQPPPQRRLTLGSGPQGAYYVIGDLQPVRDPTPESHYCLAREDEQLLRERQQQQSSRPLPDPMHPDRHLYQIPPGPPRLAPIPAAQQGVQQIASERSYYGNVPGSQPPPPGHQPWLQPRPNPLDPAEEHLYESLTAMELLRIQQLEEKEKKSAATNDTYDYPRFDPHHGGHGAQGRVQDQVYYQFSDLGAPTDFYQTPPLRPGNAMYSTPRPYAPEPPFNAAAMRQSKDKKTKRNG